MPYLVPRRRHAKSPASRQHQVLGTPSVMPDASHGVPCSLPSARPCRSPAPSPAAARARACAPCFASAALLPRPEASSSSSSPRVQPCRRAAPRPGMRPPHDPAPPPSHLILGSCSLARRRRHQVSVSAPQGRRKPRLAFVLVISTPRPTFAHTRSSVVASASRFHPGGLGFESQAPHIFAWPFNL